jgi:hypothetical protein
MGLFSRKPRPGRSEPEATAPAAPEPAGSDLPAEEGPAGPAWSGRALRLPAPPSVGTMPALAGSVVGPAESISGAQLRYRSEDLAVVDAILDGFREPGSDLTAETVWCFGAYIGQTMVERAGGVWVDGPDAQRLGAAFAVRLPNGVVANPIGRAFRRVDEGPTADVPYFYRTMTEAPSS